MFFLLQGRELAMVQSPDVDAEPLLELKTGN